MSDPELEISALTTLAALAPEDWDACACPEVADGGPAIDPFTTYRFLSLIHI